jgi:hypothetical protein
MAVKNAIDLQPGDVISLGLAGPQMIVAIKPVGPGLAIICDCGEKAVIPYDCTMYIYHNRDEQLRLAYEREKLERERIERQIQARAEQDQRRLADKRRRQLASCSNAGCNGW